MISVACAQTSGYAVGYGAGRGAFISGQSYNSLCTYRLSDKYCGAFKIGYATGCGGVALLH